MSSTERIFSLKIALIIAFRLLGLFMLLPIFSIYAQNYSSTTPFLIGLTIGIYGLTQALLQIPFGYLSDQYGRKPLAIIGIIIFFIGSVIAANANDIIEVIIGRAMQGAGAISAVLMAFLADYVRPAERIKANAFVGMQIGVAFMLSILLGPIIAANFGISGVFWITAGLAIIGFFVILSLPNSQPKAQYKLSLVNFSSILKGDLLRLDFGIFFLHLILTASFVVLPIMLQDSDINANNSWQFYLPVMLFSFVLMMPFIIFAKKNHQTNTIMLVAIALLAISQVLIYTFSGANYLIYLLILTVFFTAFNSLEALMPSMVAAHSGAEKRGLAMGIFSTSQFLGAFFGGIFGGLIYNIFNLNMVFLFTALIATIWWIIMSINISKTKT